MAVTTSVTTLVCSPAMIEATVWEALGRPGRLEVVRSPLVKERHRLYAPIKEYLSNTCSVVVEEGREDDDDMAWGEAIYTEYDIFTECPGDIDHHCCMRRFEP